ncbi:hypothetical protein EV175_003335 [Coemansia sp. RSA 1933]|nr:hypothetical protein EV175_003335 [Coemansia sp. RSA 1933]
MTSSTVGGRARNAANQEVASSKHDPRRRRLSHRMSLTGQPRRSTSAPSRPHSMRMSRRKSWLFQLFGSSPSVDSATSSDTADDVSDHGSDDARCRRVSRRRRVLTQSSDEITQFLGHLRLEDSGNGGGTHVGELRVPAAHINDVLEDVIDVSGEDEELANRPSMSVAEVRQQTLDTLNGTVRVTQQPPSILDSMTGRCEQTGVADDCESVDQSISRWRQRDASGPTITRLNPPAVTSTSPGNSPTKDSASNRPGQASSLGLGVSVARRDRTPVSYLPSITQTAASHSPVTPTRKEWSIGDGKSPASASGSGTGTPTRHMRQSSGTSIQSDDSSAVARKWAPAFWAPPSLNYHAGEPLGSPTAAGGSSWSPRESIDSVERRPSYTRRPSEESRYRSPHGSIGLQPPAAGSGGGPPPPASIGRNGGASGSPWELVKFSESRSFPLSPSHSRPGTPPSRQLGFFEDTTVPDSDELTVAARRSLSLRMSRNAFRQVEPLPESDDVSESSSVRKLDGGDGKRDGRRTSRIRSEGKQAADGLADASSKPKQDQAKNPALSRVAGSAQHKRRSLLWQFKEAKNSSSSSTVVASKTLSGQQLAQNEPSSASSTHEYSETASDTRDMMSHTPRGGSDFLASDRPSEHTSHQNLAAVTSGTKKHKRWWSVVLG